MRNKTRKHIWPVSLVMSIAIIGALAAFLVLANNPGATMAHGDVADHDAACTAMSDQERREHNASALLEPGEEVCDGATSPGNGGNGSNGNGTNGTPAGTMLKSSSTSGGAGIQLTLTIVAADMENLHAGDRIEIYLEDDYSVPDSISTSDVYFRVPRGGVGQNNGGRVNAADVSIDDSDHFTPDKDDWAIAILVPEMDPRDDEFGYPVGNRDLVVVIEKDAGIKNPTEEGDHSNGYSILTGQESDNDGPEETLDVLNTWAKISLSVTSGGRGKEVTVTGSGFNDDTGAEVFVLVEDAVDEDATPPVEAPSCADIVDTGESLGTATVGSDNKFTIPFTVHQDEFKPGKVNYICAEDSEAGNPREASAVKTFDLTASISLDPTEANSGDEVTLKARDFGGPLTSISLGPRKTWTLDATDTDAFPIKEITNNNMDYTFDVPGGLSGVIQVDATLGSTRKTADLTITPSSLKLSKAEVAPNETIIISGSGFNEAKTINVNDIKLDGKSMVVDDAGTQACGVNQRCVKTTSSGEFTATVSVWAMGDNNPALDDDEYTIEVTDSEDFVGKAKITILEATVSVMPEMASPRDFITISGENWPISTADDDHEVTIMVDGRNRSVNIDGNGRFRYEYQLRSNIGIGDEHEVVVEFESDGGSIEEEATFEVHDAGIMLTPTEAAPGQTISLEIEGMPPYTLVDHVNIDGVNRLGGQNLNTDRHGNVMVTGVLVPYLDPGFYPVEVMVGEETRVVQLQVLAEATVAGTATALPGALEELDDSLVRVFHFNTASKVWAFFDPRDEFADLNTLTELSDGQPYWILISETADGVVLNGQTRDLTCVGGDCWNQLVW